MRTFDIIHIEYIDFKSEEKARAYYKKCLAKSGNYHIKRQGETLRGVVGRLKEREEQIAIDSDCLLYSWKDYNTTIWTLKLVIHYER